MALPRAGEMRPTAVVVGELQCEVCWPCGPARGNSGKWGVQISAIIPSTTVSAELPCSGLGGLQVEPVPCDFQSHPWCG